MGQPQPSASVLAGIGRTLSAASAGESLQRLLTGGGEDESFAAAMETVPPWVSNMGVPQPPWMYPACPSGPQAPASASMMPPRWSMDNLTVQTAVPCGGMPCMYPSLASEQTTVWGSRTTTASSTATAAGAAAAQSPFRQDLHRASQDVGLSTHFSANQLCIGPPVGRRHSFHQETKGMGIVQPDFRQFTKVGYEGRLSVVSESQVHQDGLQRYLVQFTSGELSRADGVGFVFSQRLPCAKNIQRIVSIFVNQRGRICMRAFAELERASAFVKPLELGDCVELAIDLTNQVCCFNIWECTDSGWPDLTGIPASSAELNFGARMSSLSQAAQKPVNLTVGHLACVVKNEGVSITLLS